LDFVKNSENKVGKESEMWKINMRMAQNAS
jgi:hypothetical protein